MMVIKSDPMMDENQRDNNRLTEYVEFRPISEGTIAVILRHTVTHAVTKHHIM